MGPTIVSVSGAPSRFGVLIAVLAVLFSAALKCGPAEAAGPAHFVLEYCDPSAPLTSDPQLVYAVSPAEGVPVRWFNDCLQPGGSIGIQEVGNSGDASASLSISIPPTPGGYVESESILGGTAALGEHNTQVFIGTPGWPFANGGEDLRVFRLRSSPPEFGSAGGDFTIGWNCAGPLNSCSAGPIVYARDISVTEVDPSPPTINAGGEIFSGHVKRGHQKVEATAQDLGGGVSSMEVRVNGLPAAPAITGMCSTVAITNLGYKGTAAVSPTPCPSQYSASWNLSTAEYPFHDGANSVEACASDFATVGDANSSCSPAQTVAVDNTCPESSVSGGETLSAGFEGGGPNVVVPYDSGAAIVGGLSDTNGEPIAGATICIQTEVQGSDEGERTQATTTTDSAGRFKYELQAGPNRQVLLGYRHDSFQLAQTIGFHSHTRPSISIRPRRVRPGGRIRVRGTLPSPRAAGRVVILQAASLHGRWLTFHRVTTDRQGRFTASYRFGSSSGITYRIRALSPRQRGYPYDPGHSKPALVTVRG